MRIGLEPDELGDLLSLPLNAVIATRLRSGEVSLTPVWFWWDGARFVLQFPAGDRKIARLTADPRISVLVGEVAYPYRGIEVRGTAEISTADYHDVGMHVVARYVERLDPGADPLSYLSEEAGAIVRVHSLHVRAWDDADGEFMPPGS